MKLHLLHSASQRPHQSSVSNSSLMQYHMKQWNKMTEQRMLANNRWVVILWFQGSLTFIWRATLLIKRTHLGIIRAFSGDLGMIHLDIKSKTGLSEHESWENRYVTIGCCCLQGSFVNKHRFSISAHFVVMVNCTSSGQETPKDPETRLIASKAETSSFSQSFQGLYCFGYSAIYADTN